jgi:hypothetical protein
VYVVNAEDMKVLQEILIDYSPLLISPSMTYSNNKLKVLAIESFKLVVSSDKELL